MESQVLVSILRTPPISGTIRERLFDVASQNTWVRFEPDDDEPWAGVFGCGESPGHSAVVELTPSDTVLVLSGGEGYFVNRNTGALLSRSSWFAAESAIAIPGRAMAAVASSTYAWLVTCDAERTVWNVVPHLMDRKRAGRSQRIALDGVIFDSATRDRVSGKVWEVEGWHACRIDVESGLFTRGAFLTAKWEAFRPLSPAL